MVRRKKIVIDSEDETHNTGRRKRTRGERERTHTHEISKKNKSVVQSKKIVEDKRRKGKMVAEESDTSSESDLPIVLKKRRSRYVVINSSEGEAATSSESEKHSRKHRPRKRAKKSSKNEKKSEYISESTYSMSSDTSSDDSSDGDGHIDGFRKPNNCFGLVDVDKASCYFRSNLKNTIKDLKQIDFKDTHLRELERTPFWILFEALYRMCAGKTQKRCSKYEEDIRQILLCFDDLTEGLMIAGQKLSISKIDFELIFGIFGGSKTIPLKTVEYVISPWVRRCFGGDMSACDGQFVLYKKTFYDKLKEFIQRDDNTTSKDVARLTICYLFGSLLAPNQSGSISWQLTVYLEQFEKIGEYRWSKFFVEMLRNQIATSKTLRVGGCAMLLPFWICEHTKLIRPKEGEHFPRFLKWDLEELHDKIIRVKLTKLNTRYIRKVFLKCKSTEKEKMKMLKQKWKMQDNTEETEVDHESASKGITSNDEDNVENTAGLRTDVEKKKLLLLNFDQNNTDVDIPASSKIGSNKLVFEEASPCVESVQPTQSLLAVGDCPSFSLGMTQYQTTEQQVNDVINNVIDDIRVDGGAVGDDMPGADQGSIFSDSGKLDETDMQQKVNEKTSGEDGEVGQVADEGYGVYKLQEKLQEKVDVGKFNNAGDVGTMHDGVEHEYANQIKKLNAMVEQLRGEKALMSDTYLGEIQLKDEAIRRLENENIDLKNELEMIIVPSATQFYSNPDNMEMLDTLEKLAVTKSENEKLLKENAELQKCMGKNEAEVNVGKEEHFEGTPCTKRRQKCNPEPSSMIQRVKQRTVQSLRVPKDLTPQVGRVGRVELIELHEGIDDDQDDHTPLNQRRLRSKPQPYRMDGKHWAVRTTKDHIKQLIKETWDNVANEG
ncbi:hypothetical protein ACS0TY_014182 [Phlomoides rotata]